MSKKRFINFYEGGKIVGVADDNDIWLCEDGSIADLLNEQQDIIQSLQKENTFLVKQREYWKAKFDEGTETFEAKAFLEDMKRPNIE